MSGQRQEQWEKQLSGQPMRNHGFTSDIQNKVRERIRMEQRNNKPNRWFRTAAALTSVVIVLGGGWLLRDDISSLLKQKPSGMEGVPAALQNDVLADENATLKVMVGQYDNFNNMQYARPFLLHHPTVTVETAQMPDKIYQGKELLEWVDLENPDVLRLSLQQYYELAKAGKLKSLDTLIKSDAVDVDAMYEPVIDILRQYGGGQLYGLTPAFQTDAVFINKELFEKNGIPLPSAGMSWDELLDTAARFQGTGTAGLYSGDNLNGLINKIGEAIGLQTDTQGGKQVTIDSPAWAELWTKITNGYQDGWIQDKGADGNSNKVSFTPSDPFLNGNAAMLVTSGYYIQQIQSAAKDELKWMTIPVPGDQISSFYVTEIYAVSSTASSDKAAWEMVKFMNGSEFAKRLIGTGMNRTPIRQSDALQKYSEEQIAGFYPNKLELPEDWQNAAEGKPSSNALIGYAYQESGPLLKDVIAGTLTVDQALAQLKEKLEQHAQQDARNAQKEQS